MTLQSVHRPLKTPWEDQVRALRATTSRAPPRADLSTCQVSTQEDYHQAAVTGKHALTRHHPLPVRSFPT